MQMDVRVLTMLMWRDLGPGDLPDVGSRAHLQGPSVEPGFPQPDPGSSAELRLQIRAYVTSSQQHLRLPCGATGLS